MFPAHFGKRLQTLLQFPDDAPHLPRREEPWTKRASRVLAGTRGRAQRIAHGRRHVIKLPADLFFECSRAIRGRKGYSFDRVRSRA